jgi:hypothetical protein
MGRAEGLQHIIRDRMKVKAGVSNSRVQYSASISGLIVLCLTARFCCSQSLKGQAGQAGRNGNVS